MTKGIVRISDPDVPVAITLSAADLLLIDKSDATSATGYRTNKIALGASQILMRNTTSTAGDNILGAMFSVTASQSGAWGGNALLGVSVQDQPCISAAVTISIATPGVITWPSHGLPANTGVIFTTTGALPAGLTAGTIYWVIGSSITTNTFEVSAVRNSGIPINTAGSQSGTHTGTTAPSFPCGISGLAVLTGAQNVIFAAFARTDMLVAGAGIGMEIDTNNSSGADAPSTFPANLGLPVTASYPIALQLVNIGPKKGHTALRITSTGQIGGVANPYLAGIYIDKGGASLYGITVDADGTTGPEWAAVLRTNGQSGAPILLMQSMGTVHAKNAVVQHQQPANTSFQVNQDGSVIINQDAPNVDAASLPIPTTYGLYLAGLTGAVPTICMDGFANLPVMRMRRASGSGTSPGNVATSDIIGIIASNVKVNGAYSIDTARITFTYTGAGGTNADNGTSISFNTTLNGATSVSQAVLISASGGLLIGGGATDPGTGGLAVSGNTGHGLNAITSAWVAIAAGTTAKSQINFAAATVPTSPNNGDFWFDGTNVKIRVSGTTKTFTIT